MDQTINCDICVIGGGAAGLSVASGAAQLGARTVLFERATMGGDCLNHGCVPSKALIAAAHAAHAVRRGHQFGIEAGEPRIAFSAVMQHVRRAIDTIAPHDSVERFTTLGVHIIQAPAAFVSSDEVRGGGFSIRARRFVIAAGSAPAVPPIEGLSGVPYLTNETLFGIEQRPSHLVVIGAGPVGVEMAQAFRRLGSDVTLIGRGKMLAKDDPELSAVVRSRLLAEGVRMRENATVRRVYRNDAGICVALEPEQVVTGSHVLIATGRAPRVYGLGLEAAGVAYENRGIAVDRSLRTSNRRVYAIGDIVDGPRFTHVAGYHAGIVVRNALFRLPAEVDYRALPWVTYTDPELAHVGLLETAARRQHSGIEIVQTSFDKNDRAVTEGDTQGLAKIVVKRDGRILGASIVGPQAGELIQIWALAISRKLTMKAVSGVILPYPTRGEMTRAAVGAYYGPKLYGRWPRRLVRLLSSFG